MSQEYQFNATQAMTSKELGKIRDVRFGMGGYQDCQFGLSLTFESKGTVVGHFDGFWADRSSGAKWSEEDQVRYFGETMKRLRGLLKDAGVDSVERLKGIPVELTFTGSMLSEFRVLTEVL